MNIADQIKTLVAKLEARGQQFEALERADWVVAIEEKLGRPLPPSFRCLVTRFAFAEFDVGGVTLFANLNDGSPMDVTVAPFSDPFLSQWLINHGYVQFGRPDTANYDPVCFDFSEKRKEPTVVVLDHEDILLERKKVRVRKLADSFIDLMQAGTHETRD